MAESRTTRRQHARRHGRRAAVIAACTVALLFADVAVGGWLRDSDDSRAAPAPSSTTTSTTVAPVEPPTIATTTVEVLEVRAEPSAAAPSIASLAPTTEYGFPTTMLVDSTLADSAPGWVPVLVPFHKPNSTVGWASADEVTLAETTYEIRISLSRHELVFLNSGEPVLSTSVILGTSETPTPPGRFYVTDPLNCGVEGAPGYPVSVCDEAYGAFAIGISGLSEALDSFKGTIPQLAVHGTNLPGTELGKDLSNGCVRIPNDIVLAIARATPLLGVPVTITA